MRLQKLSHTCALKPPYLKNSIIHICSNNRTVRTLFTYLFTFTFFQLNFLSKFTCCWLMLSKKHLSGCINFRSDQISCWVVSNSLRPHESQYARPPCPSQLPEFTQTHVHRVNDAIQPSHPLSSPSPPPPNPSQHQNLFQWVNSSHEVAKVLEFQL